MITGLVAGLALSRASIKLAIEFEEAIAEARAHMVDIDLDSAIYRLATSYDPARTLADEVRQQVTEALEAALKGPENPQASDQSISRKDNFDAVDPS